MYIELPMMQFNYCNIEAIYYRHFEVMEREGISHVDTRKYV